MPKNLNSLTIIQDYFAINPELKIKCLINIKDKINKNLANRIFDDLPLLINEPTFSLLIKQFNALLEQPTRKSVREFEKSIIAIGCRELLNEKGYIKQELIDTFEWQDCASLIDNYHIICAFVGVTTSYIAKESLLSTHTNNNKFSATVIYINKNYDKWILEMMDEYGFKYNASYHASQSNTCDIIAYPINKPMLTAALLTGGLFGAVTYCGYQLYKNFLHDNKNLEVSDFDKPKPI